MSGHSILVTGGWGNIGRWLVQALAKRGHCITVLSSQARPKALLETITCDLSDIVQCRSALSHREFDVVVHAASANDASAPNYPELALRINALGTRNLLEVLPTPRHFIYLSTVHVYGTASGEIDENSAVSPRNDYALTHLFAEHYVRQFHALRALSYTILRLTNGYGCPKSLDTTKWYLLLNDLARMAYEDKRIVLRSNGKARRDFIWLGTVCDVISTLTECQTAPNDLFNLAAGRSWTLLEVAEFVQQAYREYCGRELEIERNASDTSDSGELRVSCAKLQALIPYKPQVRFVEEAVDIFKLLQQTR
jgi:UDP-glucose 4-epimerase